MGVGEDRAARGGGEGRRRARERADRGAAAGAHAAETSAPHALVTPVVAELQEDGEEENALRDREREGGDRDKRAVDCIRRLLQIDPTKRLTAEELCKHPWLKQGLTADDGKADSAMPEVMPPRAHTASEEYFQGQKKALPVETASTAPPKGASPYIVPEDPPPEETLEAGGAAESAPLMKKRLSFSHRDLETGDLVYKDENGVVVAETVAATPEEEAAPIASGEETAVAPPIEE